jgi:hypothetical protein
MNQNTDDRPIFMKPGHNAGDLVESGKWKILTEAPGLVEVEAHLPEHLLNPRNQLFGGFTWYLCGYDFSLHLSNTLRERQ